MRVHKYDYTYWDNWPEPVDVFLCGRSYGLSESDWSKVTCKHCLARKSNLKKRPKKKKAGDE